ncbi:MAG: SurA N-terminal domain-containing protein [Proteobacteria bacterium]|nr:SurA N-terminal domain-containing protein [Pseudomonadota bacterium]MBU2227460.1 SurA N-terminal domain-containing protein [Pseudomonadota bacterium]MBU2260913.1 SurA N-terminal domain-containing protein [Pseudomonadota bacterium]
MLDLMRKHARNWLMKTILGIIIIVFIFYFGSIGQRQRAERIAMIDGKPIVQVDFQREYQNLVDLYRQRLGPGLTEEMIKGLNLKQQALDNLINQAVVLKKAEEMGVRATDEDVTNAILAYPAFQRNGAFDQRIYEQTLRTNKMVADEFEEIQRMMLITLRVQDLIEAAVKVSEEEVLDFYRMQNEKIALDFIRLSSKTFAGGIKPSPADLEAFLKANEGRFRVPEQAQMKYLLFSGQDHASTVKVSEAEVNDYYERRKAEWTKGGKTQSLPEVRDRIVTTLRQIAGIYAAADEAKKAHDTIYQEENFDAYAAQKKLTVHTTGLFHLSEPPAEFRSIADFTGIVSKLAQDQISRVLQGERGYYIVKLVARKAPYLPALKEIEAEVEKQYRQTEADKLAKGEAEALLARLKKGEGLEAVAREKGLKVEETGLFQPGSAVPKLGASAELTEALFEISEKKPYPKKVFPVEGNYVLVRFRERGKADDKGFASQKEAIAKYLLQVKKGETFRSWIEGSKAALLKEGRLELTKELKDL